MAYILGDLGYEILAKLIVENLKSYIKKEA